VKAYIARIKQAAKSAPGNVKSALNKIASTFGSVSSAADAQALLKNKDYQKAASVVGRYLIQCVTVPTT
jgi:hypothetical protein